MSVTYVGDTPNSAPLAVARGRPSRSSRWRASDGASNKPSVRSATRKTARAAAASKSPVTGTLKVAMLPAPAGWVHARARTTRFWERASGSPLPFGLCAPLRLGLRI